MPALLPVSSIKARLQDLFPASFPDRGLLVGDMAARVVFVFLYGGFVEGREYLLRPSFVYLFTQQQARKTTDVQRALWRGNAVRAGFRPAGTRWYADNSRESIRDDLIRNRLLRLGIVRRASGVPTTSSRPIYQLAGDFAALFSPGRTGSDLDGDREQWHRRHLDAGALSRMQLRSERLAADPSDVLIDMPDRTRVRLSAGPSSSILKGIIESFAPRYMHQPAVLWISASDKKIWPQFVETARLVGLRFSPSTELPDLILADLDETSDVRFVFCEVVATDGAVTPARREALMRIVEASRLPAARVEFLSAFEDREAAPFKRSVGTLASDGMAWFRTEPNLLLRLERLR